MKCYTVSADLTATESGLQIKAILEQLAALDTPCAFIRLSREGGFEFAVPESAEDEAELEPIRHASRPSTFPESGGE